MNSRCTKIQKTHIAVMLATASFLLGTGVDLYVPSLPAITRYFHANPHVVQLTIGFYMLGYATGQFFLGMLSDNLGRKKVLLLSGIFYVLISITALFSPSAHSLVLLRFLQGVGVAGIAVVARAIASDCFSGIDLTKAMINCSLCWSTGTIVGPFIGGYLQHYFGWQANFHFFWIYGLIVTIYSALFIPETRHKLSRTPIKKILSEAKVILTTPTFLVAGIIASLAYSILLIFNTIGPFLIQDILKYSAVNYGHIALVLGTSYLIGNFLNRILVNHFEPMKIMFTAIIASLLIGAATALLSIFVTINLLIITIPVFLLFITTALIIPSMIAKCVSLFPKLGGTANAVVGLLLGAGVFATSSVASRLPIHSQMPMEIMFVSIFTLCLIASLASRKLDARFVDATQNINAVEIML